MSQVVLLQASHFVILEFGCLQLIIRDGLRIHNSHVVILDAGLRASIPRRQVGGHGGSSTMAFPSWIVIIHDKSHYIE